jgi:hypothetical protein
MIFILIILGTIGQNLTVEQESKQYGDIIQIDQVDFYYHNSCKFYLDNKHRFNK